MKCTNNVYNKIWDMLEWNKLVMNLQKINVVHVKTALSSILWAKVSIEPNTKYCRRMLMDMWLFWTTVVSKNNPLNVHLTGLYVSLAETILNLCMVYKFSSCKISLNFEIIFSCIATCSGVSCCSIFKSANQVKIKILNKFNQYKICLN